jgi:demethylmenaquinone methyltransferase / 2-methoxy-6-polyprenyl-1,4-benzoquinol methylase
MIAMTLIACLAGIIAFLVLKTNGPAESGATLGSGPMFDSIAPYYDSANKFMSLGFDQSWRRSLVDELNVKVDDVVLDISTGTGDVAIWIAKKFQELDKNDGQPVTGFDPSSKMLSYAALKIHEGSYENLIKLVLGDAQDMFTLADNYYTKVSMSFGIRNVPDRMKALREIYRVMHPNGSKVIIMEFSTPLSGFLAPMAKTFLHSVVPLHNAEYDHLRDSILNFPSPAGFKQMMIDSGFTDCINKDLFFDVVHLYVCHKIVANSVDNEEVSEQE